VDGVVAEALPNTIWLTWPAAAARISFGCFRATGWSWSWRGTMSHEGGSSVDTTEVAATA